MQFRLLGPTGASKIELSEYYLPTGTIRSAFIPALAPIERETMISIELPLRMVSVWHRRSSRAAANNNVHPQVGSARQDKLGRPAYSHFTFHL